MNQTASVKYFYIRDSRALTGRKDETFPAGTPAFVDGYVADKTGRLLSLPVQKGVPGGVLCLRRADFSEEPEASALFFRSVAAECDAKEYHGVFFDCRLKGPSPSFLAAGLAARGLTVFFRDDVKNPPEGCVVVVDGMVLGGSFAEMLYEKASRYGASRLCLSLAEADVLLPADRNKPPRKLRPAESLSEGEGAYSQALGLAYRVVREGESLGVVLSETPETIGRKLSDASSMGITRAVAPPSRPQG